MIRLWVTGPDGRVSVARCQLATATILLLVFVFLWIVLNIGRGLGLLEVGPNLLLFLGVAAFGTLAGLGLETATTRLGAEAIRGLSKLELNREIEEKQRRLAHLGWRDGASLSIVQLAVVLLLAGVALGLADWRALRGQAQDLPIQWHWLALLALSELVYLGFAGATLARKKELEALAEVALKEVKALAEEAETPPGLGAAEAGNASEDAQAGGGSEPADARDALSRSERVRAREEARQLEKELKDRAQYLWLELGPLLVVHLQRKRRQTRSRPAGRRGNTAVR